MSQSGPYWTLLGWLSQPWCCSVLTEPLLSLTDYFRTPITAGNNWNHDVYGNPWQDQNHWALYGRLCHCEVCYLLASMELKLTSHQDIIWLNITSKTHVNANSDIYIWRGLTDGWIQVDVQLQLPLHIGQCRTLSRPQKMCHTWWAWSWGLRQGEIPLLGRDVMNPGRNRKVGQPKESPTLPAHPVLHGRGLAVSIVSISA